jgi:hypothetical protein
MTERAAHLQLISPSASPEEAAAIVAALERFMRATATTAMPLVQASDQWRSAAMLEGVCREDQGDRADPWINT